MSEWKVNKEINLGEVLTMLALIITFISAMIGFSVVLDRRIEGNTNGIKFNASGVQQNSGEISALKSGQIETNNKIESLRLEQKQDIKDLGRDLSDQIDGIKDILIQNRNK